MPINCAFCIFINLSCSTLFVFANHEGNHMKAHLEVVKTPPKSSFTAFRYTDDSFKSPWHYHPEFEVAYILKGSGLRYVGTTVENFSAGDLVLLGPHLPHCWKDNHPGSKTVESIIVQWKKEFLGEAFSCTAELSRIQDLLSIASKGVKFGRKVSSELDHKLKKLPETHSFERLLVFLDILNELANAPESEIICEHEFDFQLDYVDSDRINKVQKYVEENYQKKIRLSDVGSLVNMTEEYFSRYFSKVMDQPFFSYLNKYRVNMACRLLIESDVQVVEICYDCGYDSLPHFHRQFKKIKGMSPLKYREAYRPSFNIG